MSGLRAASVAAAVSLAVSIAVRDPLIASGIAVVASVFGQVGAVNFPVTGTDQSTPANPGAGLTKLYPKNGTFCTTSTISSEQCLLINALQSGQAPQFRFRSGFYYPVQAGGVSGTGILTQGIEFADPFYVPTTTTFTRMATWIITGGAAGAVVRFGIYADNGGRPGNIILDAATVASTTSAAVAEVTINQSLTSGTYWVSLTGQVAASGGTTPVYAVNAIPVGYDVNTELSGTAGAYIRTGITGALGNWSGPATTTGGAVTIALKVQ